MVAPLGAPQEMACESRGWGKSFASKGLVALFPVVAGKRASANLHLCIDACNLRVRGPTKLNVSVEWNRVLARLRCKVSMRCQAPRER